MTLGGMIMKNREKVNKTVVEKTVKTGISFGSALAMVVSYVNWHSLFWAIIHGVMGWGYIVYFVIRY